jgi:hypothetical protein
MTDPVMLLSQVHGEGRVTFRALRAAGFYTLASVADAPVQTLADRAHLSGRTARRLKSGAEEMIDKGIGKDHPGPDAAALAGRGRASRAARAKEPAAASAIPAFSDGVSLEEAFLLCQDLAIEETASAEPAPPPTPRLPEIAAAAEAAAALTRPPASIPATTPAPSRPRKPHEPDAPQCATFWTFG